MNLRPILDLTLTVALLLGGTAAATPMGTAFTYQGYLDDGGVPATGKYDFEFTLWDAASGGSLIGAAVQANVVELVDGVFSVELDFGAGAFAGDERWLEIHAAPTTQPLQALTPRQKINAAPYALFALNGGGGGGSGYWQLNGTNILNTNSGNVGIGVANPARKLVVGGEGEFQGRAHARSAFNLYDASGGAFRASLYDGMLGGTPLGGQLQTWDENGTLTAMVGSAITDGGMLDLFSADGSQGVLAYGGTTHGDLGIWNDGQDRTAFLTGDEGDLGADLTLHNGRTKTVELDANQNQGGYLGLSRSDGAETVQLMANQEDGAGYLRLREGTATRAEISAQGSGTMVLRNNMAIGTIAMDAGAGSTNSGVVQVKSEFGQHSVMLYGDYGDGYSRVVTDVLQILGGADLAEGFDVAAGEQDEIQPGMVVSIDVERPGKLRVSEQAYDRRVAGIVSGAEGIRPGMVMGQNGSIADGEHPIALTGRVYCLADASNGPIEPGDLLTTSGVPGHAMRVDDFTRAQGAILGKAMTSLESGRGTVLVLVGLQ